MLIVVEGVAAAVDKGWKINRFSSNKPIHHHHPAQFVWNNTRSVKWYEPYPVFIHFMPHALIRGWLNERNVPFVSIRRLDENEYVSVGRN